MAAELGDSATSDPAHALGAASGGNVLTAAELDAARQEQLSRGGGRRVLEVEQRDARMVARLEARAERLQARRERERKRRAAERERRQALAEARAWRPPLTGYDITATFGQSSSLWSTVHTGVDLAAPSGMPVTSTAPGTVTFAGYDGAYGYKVVVEHENGTATWYAHLASLSVNVGEVVSHHTVVGPVGSTGNVTGPHLHLEVRPTGGEPVDPVAALAGQGVHL
ncbi:M23 family metallopeptidase [Nocardioides caldifontis]|uniref:M23 family metallopeptidase n=1 Tax=Nocardioides caldifontis TaxID=2588938 RepID=UPI0011DF146A|nr:M23 family metallopeptidase [Nocardioides caldifontis]